MENLLVVVGLFNFYNIVSNDLIIEKKHDILTKRNLLIYSEFITKKYNISSQQIFKKQTISSLIQSINVAINSANLQIEIDTQLKAGELDPSSIHITTEQKIKKKKKPTEKTKTKKKKQSDK
jgi:hypothetical protein